MMKGPVRTPSTLSEVSSIAFTRDEYHELKDLNKLYKKGMKTLLCILVHIFIWQ